MSEILYIKTPQCINISDPHILLKDFLTIYCESSALKNRVLNLPFYTFSGEQPGQLVVSILKVIELIHSHFPDLLIENLGEGDFILSYQPPSKVEHLKEGIATLFICLIAFFGGGYAIMAYNTDVGAKELFSNLSMLFLGNAKTGVAWITIAYAIGLAVGMILFFNHFGQKKLDCDPTPLEVQMRLYEQDISTTVIKDISRRGESLDARQ